MRLGLVFVSVSVSLLAAASAWAADPAEEGAPVPAAAPAPPPEGYPAPPPEGYGAPPQERTANNSIYIEGLGPGIFYSINYDRTFGDFAGRVGFSYISVSASATTNGNTTSEAHASFMTIPLTLSYIGIGSKKHIFEVGAGATIVHVGAGGSAFAVDEKSGSASATAVLGNMIFGYRMQPPDGGFLLRAGLSPIFGGGSFIPLPYLALGGTF